MSTAASPGGAKAPDNPPLGMALCALSMFVFAVQDSFTRLVVGTLSPLSVMMVRLWIFAAFAILLAAWRGRLRAAFRPRRPVLQAFRALFSAAEIVTIAWALKYLGLAEAHSLFASFPLMAALMARLALGERLPPWRLLAILAGFAGALLIVRPGFGVFRPEALIALAAAALFAAYQVSGRLASRHDDFLTNIVQISLIGALALTPFGLWQWQPPDGRQWLLIGAITACGIAGHMLLVKAVEHAPASALQPFNYLLLAFAFLFGVVIFHERPDALSILGALVIAASGLYAILRK